MNKEKTEFGSEPDVGFVGHKSQSRFVSNRRLGKNKTKQVLCSSSARLSGLFNFWSWHITHCWADILNEHECRVETTNKPRALPSLMSHQQQQRNVDKLGRISKLVWMLWTCYEQCHVIWETWNNVILKQYDKTCDNADLYSYLDKVTS